MSGLSRRTLILSGGALAGLSACGNGMGSDRAARLDARVDATRQFLVSRYPGTGDVIDRAAGVLYMPLMTEAGLFVGGAYGQGALRINNVTVDYYSAAQASWGLQVGAQQYAHVLAFMTQAALEKFRRADGWAVGADAKYATPAEGGSVSFDTTTTNAPVIIFVFGQSGLMASATIEGTKYTRIIP